MTEEEQKELARLEGPTLSLTDKPIVTMSDAELEAFVARSREVTTQIQTLVAHNRVRADDKEDVNKDLFE